MLRRRLFRLSAPLVALAVLPMTAVSAAAPSHLVSFAQARTAMPSAADMPGDPQKIVTTTSGDRPTPCVGPKAVPLTMKQSHQVTTVYVSDPGSVNSLATMFAITAYVFHTAAAAGVGMEAILHAEAHCPKHQRREQGASTRSLSAKYTSAGWVGWRSIDHVVQLADPDDPSDPGIAQRVNTEFLLRGNVVLTLMQTGNLTATNGAHQEATRKRATKAMLAGFAKL